MAHSFTNALINEARFAALYGVPGPRIIVAARTVSERLDTARRALQPEPAEADKWTLLARPRAPAVQYEHTIVATRRGALVVTLPS